MKKGPTVNTNEYANGHADLDTILIDGGSVSHAYADAIGNPTTNEAAMQSMQLDFQQSMQGLEDRIVCRLINCYEV